MPIAAATNSLFVAETGFILTTSANTTAKTLPINIGTLIAPGRISIFRFRGPRVNFVTANYIINTELGF